MSEDQEGGMSGLKKTILGVLGTAVTGVGIWATTQINTILGIEEEGGAATEQVAPVEQSNNQSVNVSGPAITINVPEQQQQAASSHTTVIKETVREVPAAQPAAPVEEKKETTAERIARLKKDKAAKDGTSN
jgi:hypothetical protein